MTPLGEDPTRSTEQLATEKRVELTARDYWAVKTAFRELTATREGGPMPTRDMIHTYAKALLTDGSFKRICRLSTDKDKVIDGYASEIYPGMIGINKKEAVTDFYTKADEHVQVGGALLMVIGRKPEEVASDGAEVSVSDLIKDGYVMEQATIPFLREIVRYRRDCEFLLRSQLEDDKVFASLQEANQSGIPIEWWSLDQELITLSADDAYRIRLNREAIDGQERVIRVLQELQTGPDPIPSVV